MVDYWENKALDKGATVCCFILRCVMEQSCDCRNSIKFIFVGNKKSLLTTESLSASSLHPLKGPALCVQGELFCKSCGHVATTVDPAVLFNQQYVTAGKP